MTGIENKTTWIILKTSSMRTLSLMRALLENGIDAWSPSEVRNWRVPRSNKRIEREKPMMPGFVFADAGRLSELRDIITAPSSPYPPYSIFRWNDSYPVIADQSLEPLRRLERAKRTQRALKERAAALPAGTKVRTGGGFEGMIGVVEKTHGQFAKVIFPGWKWSIDIASCLLEPEAVSAKVSRDDTAEQSALAS